MIMKEEMRRKILDLSENPLYTFDEFWEWIEKQLKEKDEEIEELKHPAPSNKCIVCGLDTRMTPHTAQLCVCLFPKVKTYQDGIDKAVDEIISQLTTYLKEGRD